MILSEPTTTLTDYAIAVAALIFAGLLLRIGWLKQQKSVCCWGVAFLWVATAAGLGGTCHGFTAQLGNPWLKLLWLIMMYALSLASLSLLLGTIFSCVPLKQQRWWLLGAIGKSTAAWAGLALMPQFSLAVADYISAMAIVLILHLQDWIESASRSAVWMIAGVLVSGLAIGCLGSGLVVSKFFNHHDLYHLVQLGGLGVLYQGAKQLRDR